MSRGDARQQPGAACTKAKPQDRRKRVPPRLLPDAASVSTNWKAFLAGQKAPVAAVPAGAVLGGAQRHVIGLRCVLVRRGGQLEGLGRVAVVDYRGAVLFDGFVETRERVEAVPGVTQEHLQVAREGRNRFGQQVLPLRAVQEAVSALIGARTVVAGHGVARDLRALMLPVAHRQLRDVAQLGNGGALALGALATELLGTAPALNDAPEEARAVLRLYAQWVQSRGGRNGDGSGSGSGSGDGSESRRGDGQTPTPAQGQGQGQGQCE